MPLPTLTVDQAVTELTTNPGNYTTYRSLLDLAARLPVDPPGVTLPPGSPPPVTLAYSGRSGIAGLSMQPIAEQIGASSGGAVRVIDQSPLAEFLQHKEFGKAATAVTQLLNPDLSGDALKTATNNNFLFDATKGPWAEGSTRFVAAAPGDVISLTPLAGYDRTFAQIEIKQYLENPGNGSFNGIPKEVLQTAYDQGVVRGGPQAGLAAATDLAAVSSGVNVASEIRITTEPDASGRPRLTGIDTGNLFAGNTGFSGLSLPDVAIADSTRLSDKLFEPSAENTAAFERGGAALQDSVSALRTVHVGGQIANGVGNVLVAYSLYEAGTTAKQQVDAGDLAGAQKTMLDWTLTNEGGLAGGAAAGAAAAQVLSPLLAGGPVGGALYLGGVLVSGAAGAVGGSAAVDYVLNGPKPNAPVLNTLDALSSTDAMGNYIPGSESQDSVGTASPNTPSYNFPNTQGAGRGSVNPDVVTPATTVFNQATALASTPTNTSEGSTPNYVVQPGDTVSGIATKLGLSAAQYTDYLKSVYGPDADLNSIVAGRELPVPANAPHAGSAPSISDVPLTAAPNADNDYQPGASNGEAEAAAYLASQNSANAALDQLVDAFNHIDTTQVGEGVQYADAGNTTGNSAVVSDAGGGGGTGNSVSNLPLAPTPSAQAAPETIANANGEVAPTPASSTPFVPYGSQYNAALQPFNAALNLLQNLNSLQHWDQMDDLGHFNSLLGLANSINTLSDGSLGNLGSYNTIASTINLAQSIENGNLLGTLSSINGLSDQAVDGALNSALGSTGVPYLSIAMALNDFEHHPGQSMGALVGMAWGPLGSAIGGTIGGLLDAAGVFGDNRPPPPEGATHYEWDANGNIQIKLDFNQSGGGAMAQSTAQSVQSLLQSIVQSINDQTPETSANQPRWSRAA